MEKKFWQIEASVPVGEEVVVEPIEQAKGAVGVEPEFILKRYEFMARAVLRAKGYTDEQSEAATLRIREITEAEAAN